MSKQPNGEPVYDNVRLKKFPIMVEELREYIEQMSTKEGFKKEYNLIPWGLRYSREVAIQPDNKLKNRYGNIIACKFVATTYAMSYDRLLMDGLCPDCSFSMQSCTISFYKRQLLGSSKMFALPMCSMLDNVQHLTFFMKYYQCLVTHHTDSI